MMCGSAPPGPLAAAAPEEPLRCCTCLSLPLLPLTGAGWPGSVPASSEPWQMARSRFLQRNSFALAKGRPFAARSGFLTDRPMSGPLCIRDTQVRECPMGHLLTEGHDRVALCRGGGVWDLVGTIPFRPAGADRPGLPGC